VIAPNRFIAGDMAMTRRFDWSALSLDAEHRAADNSLALWACCCRHFPMALMAGVLARGSIGLTMQSSAECGSRPP
jgi:hypothetical protein